MVEADILEPQKNCGLTRQGYVQCKPCLFLVSAEGIGVNGTANGLDESGRHHFVVDIISFRMLASHFRLLHTDHCLRVLQ